MRRSMCFNTLTRLVRVSLPLDLSTRHYSHSFSCKCCFFCSCCCCCCFRPSPSFPVCRRPFVVSCITYYELPPTLEVGSAGPAQGPRSLSQWCHQLAAYAAFQRRTLTIFGRLESFNGNKRVPQLNAFQCLAVENTQQQQQ